MYNIKIKSVPNKAKTGSQLDYSLVDRNTLFLKPDTQVQSDVKNTISAVPREEANIEAEGGETIIGDTNNDGFLEHQTIVGKRHSKGGVPLNVPEGSFIFSDTDKLRIKDPEILKMFGMAPNKKGYTPAEIAKKYQVNDYMAILKDETKDKYSKETAQVMLDSNLKKLGMLALVQESMKGFPDGVPAIAESVMEGMIGGGAPEQQEEEQQGQPEARYGGLTQYQTKGQVKEKQKTAGKKYDMSLLGDMQKSYDATMNNINKKGLIGHLSEWWNEKEDSDKKEPTAKQKSTVQKKSTPVEKPSPSFLDGYFNAGKAQREYFKQLPAALEKKKIQKAEKDYEDYVKKIEQEKKEEQERKQNSIIERKKALAPKVPGAIPKIGDYYFVNGQYVKIADIEMDTAGDILPDFINDPSGVYFSPAGTTDYSDKNKKYYLNFDEFKKLTNDPNAVVKKQGRAASSFYTADDNRAYNFSGVPQKIPARTYNNKTYNQGDIIKAGDDNTIEIIDPQYGVGEKNPLLNPKRFLGIGDQYNESMIVRARDKDGKIVYDNYPLRLDELDRVLSSGFAKNMSEQKNNTAEIINVTGKDSTEVNSMGVEEQVKSKEVGKPKPVMPVTAPVTKRTGADKQLIEDKVPVTFSSEEFKFGGLTQYQTKGEVKNTGKTVVSKVVSNVTGNTRVTYSDGSTEIIPANVSYDVADEELRKNVGERGYNFNELDPQYRYQHKSVGPQGKTTGYVVDPESGFYYHPDPKVGAPKPGTAGLANYMTIHKEAIDAYPGGAEAWKKTMIEAGGKENPAMSHLLEFENKAIGPIAGGKEYIDLNKRGARIPGVENFNLPGISKKQPVVVDNTQRNVDVNVDQKDIVPSITNRTRGWFTPDMLNLANAFGRKIGNFPPTLQQVAFQTGPYNLLSPEGEIAKIQSTGNMLSNQAANTMAGNVAFNAALGVQGQAIDKVTDTQGKYSNANVGISNDAAYKGAVINNQQAVANAELRDQFNTKNAIYGQQRVNAQNDKMLGITKAFNQGWGNAFKGNMLEDMFPQVGIDRVYGDIGYSGEGRNPFTYDTYINPLTSNSGTKGARANQYADFDEASLDEYEQIFNAALPRMGKENAQKYALQFISRKSRNNTYDPYNPAQAVSEGLGQMF